ncbi:hypothetical protein [Neobacillus drentensis]|uniref:hypothetical protein n=1 Tax=Neobacillus drentensis TaxID=220684 RepID=UPI00285CD0EC|nr:hypothetical protein [Neobacillus drentensis]MDR7237127.1 hypothetical protein [Neobacillus drentensis]
MSVKAKFKCCSKTELIGGSGRVEFFAVTNGSNENKTFWKYTPSGKIEMQIDNPEAFKMFEVGKEYYVDFVNPDDFKAAEAITSEPALNEQDLLTILAKNNKQLADAIEKEKAAKGNKCPDLEQATRNVGVESGEALMLIKLIQYLNGEKKIEELA